MTAADTDTVLRLNAADVRHLAPLDRPGLTRLRTWATQADVVQDGDAVVGFVVTFAPGTPYDSPNYRWFAAVYGTRFSYLDRIVIAASHRRRGLASRIYDDLEDAARPRGRMTLEVNVDPPNAASLAFHAARGYQEVGRRGEPGHVVPLLAKVLDAGGRQAEGASHP